MFPRDRRVLALDFFHQFSDLIPNMSKVLKYPKVVGGCRPPRKATLTYFMPEGYDLVEQIGGGGFST